MDELSQTLVAFLGWRLPARSRGRLSGDPISSLCGDWEMWLACLDDAERERIIQIIRTAESSPARQKAFLEWLSTLPNFGDNAHELAFHQLVQCQGFLNWSELRRFTDPSAQPHGCGVNCLFLLGRGEAGPGIIKTMVGTLGPEMSDGEPSGQILPLNFSLTGSDDSTWESLREAKQSVIRVFQARGLLFWLGYILGGDFLPLSFWRYARILFLYPRIRRIYRRRNIYLSINAASPTNVAGPSLSLGACMAGLMALSRLPNSINSRFLARFVPQLFSGLAGCAVTGKIRDGRIEWVDGVQQKLEAIRDRIEIRGVIIPKENHKTSVAPISIFTPLTLGVPCFGYERVTRALWSLIPLRKTWLIVNAALLIGFGGLVASGRTVMHSLLPPITVQGINSSAGFYKLDDLAKGGLLLRNHDHLTVRVNAHTGDGPTTLSVSFPRVGSDWTESQCLRSSFDSGDWRSGINVPVTSGYAAFEFNRGDTRQNSCGLMTLSLVHHEAEILRLVIPIIAAE